MSYAEIGKIVGGLSSREVEEVLGVKRESPPTWDERGVYVGTPSGRRLLPVSTRRDISSLTQAYPKLKPEMIGMMAARVPPNRMRAMARLSAMNWDDGSAIDRLQSSGLPEQALEDLSARAKNCGELKSSLLNRLSRGVGGFPAEVVTSVRSRDRAMSRT